MKNIRTNLRNRIQLLAAALAFSPALAWAQPGYGDTDKKVCGFLDKITDLLNMGSIAVVTIAVIFAGYQIAFAHKRIGDVAPILIGGLLIGAAGQIANMVLGDDVKECTALLLNMPMFPYA